MTMLQADPDTRTLVLKVPVGPSFCVDKRLIATDNLMEPDNPKAQALNSLMPVAFVDDFAPYLLGVDPRIHRALVMRDPDGSPNRGEHLLLADSQHSNLLEFSIWWTGSR
jgi:hypothetical protein